MKQLVLMLAVCLLPVRVPAAEADGSAEFSSGPNRVALVELYTSEGCSSCPPADRWLSSLQDTAGLWTRFVPLALHVDYWNYIGWRDRFSDAGFSQRQRALVDGGGARAVYTPGFFVDGEEWLGWRRGRTPAPADDVPGNLSIDIEGRELVAVFSPSGAVREPLSVHVALLGMNLETEVRAGENKGRRLEHDFVVLSLERAAMRGAGTVYRSTVALPPVGGEATALAVAAFVTAGDDPVPIQAVGGPLY